LYTDSECENRVLAYLVIVQMTFRHIRFLGDMETHWRNLANTNEPSTCGGDEAFCQITLTTC